MEGSDYVIIVVAVLIIASCYPLSCPNFLSFVTYPILDLLYTPFPFLAVVSFEIKYEKIIKPGRYSDVRPETV